MRPVRYRADWVLPIVRSPIRNGAVLVDEHGRIDAVGSDEQVHRPEGAELVDLGAAALLPGLVNVHAHPELSALRGVLEDLPFETWIQRLRRIKLHAPLGHDDLVTSSLWQLAEAWSAGITTIAATEDSAATFDALRAAGGRGIVFREVFGPAAAQCDDSMGHLRHSVETMRARATALVSVGISPHAPYTVSDQLFRAAAAYARAESLPVAVHVAESRSESQFVAAGAGPLADAHRRRGISTPVRARSPVALLEQAGLLALQPLLVHCVQIDENDIAAMAAAGARVAHCPAANARLGHGIAPLTALLSAGITVALGSDSVASNNRMDLLEEARIAQLMQRARLRSHDALDAERLLRMATLDGARALGLHHVIGSLEPGKSADLCAVSLERAHTRPIHDVHAALIHAARGSDNVLTVVQGQVLYRAGTHTTLDVAALGRRMEEIGARVAAVTASS